MKQDITDRCQHRWNAMITCDHILLLLTNISKIFCSLVPFLQFFVFFSASLSLRVILQTSFFLFSNPERSYSSNKMKFFNNLVCQNYLESSWFQFHNISISLDSLEKDSLKCPFFTRLFVISQSHNLITACFVHKIFLISSVSSSHVIISCFFLISGQKKFSIIFFNSSPHKSNCHAYLHLIL